MEKSKLRRFGDCKLPKYPQVEKNKHMKTLAKMAPFWLMFRVSPLTKMASFCVECIKNIELVLHDSNFCKRLAFAKLFRDRSVEEIPHQDQHQVSIATQIYKLRFYKFKVDEFCRFMGELRLGGFWEH
jgi:predicted methyltransferase